MSRFERLRTDWLRLDRPIDADLTDLHDLVFADRALAPDVIERVLA